jgi:membrane protease YdiL (CAAX protease family)
MWRHEVWLVLGVSLGQSGVYALLSLLRMLSAAEPLSAQRATLNPTQAVQPWIDLGYQLAGVLFGLVPALLAVHLLARDGGGGRSALGLDRWRPRYDVAWGAGLAAAVGIPGLGLYLLARALDLNATVVASGLRHVWWAAPVLILSAVQNAVLEEVVVVGYLCTRLEQLAVRPVLVVAASALLRGSYHLYQGFGAFVGNTVMGIVFVLFFRRTRRVGPLVVAHTLLDVVSFLGYAYLSGRLTFLR